MSTKDYFGYQRTVEPNGAIVSSEYATLSLGGGKMALVQTVRATYGQTVTAKFEVGSPTLYWITGQPVGQIELGRLVAKGGFLEGFSSLENSCGSVIPVTLGLDGTGGCSVGEGGGGSGLQFSGGVPEQVTVQFQAGLLEISEGCSIKVASMTRG